MYSPWQMLEWHTSLTQSVAAWHTRETVQRGHEWPPQSMSVSSWFLTPSMQVAAKDYQILIICLFIWFELTFTNIWVTDITLTISSCNTRSWCKTAGAWDTTTVNVGFILILDTIRAGGGWKSIWRFGAVLELTWGSPLQTCDPQTPLSQSLSTTHTLDTAQRGHERPPQSVSVSSWFFTPSVHVGAEMSTVSLKQPVRYKTYLGKYSIHRHHFRNLFRARILLIRYSVSMRNRHNRHPFHPDFWHHRYSLVLNKINWNFRLYWWYWIFNCSAHDLYNLIVIWVPLSSTKHRYISNSSVIIYDDFLLIYAISIIWKESPVTSQLLNKTEVWKWFVSLLLQVFSWQNRLLQSISCEHRCPSIQL